MIPVNEPLISPLAKKYILDCLKTGWVSSAGKYITEFENKFAAYIGTKYGVTTTNGTSALHLALVTLGIKEGDEVIIPDLTIISCALAVVYCGAKPVLVDVDQSTGNISPELIEERITKRTKAIMVVHLYGHPADMDPITTIARKYKIPVVEDAAESHGATYKNTKVGSIGDIGCFSFYGNKIVTTGEGGMLITNNKKYYERAKILKDLAHSRNKRFLHKELGYNYRMTNIQAALGLAQLAYIEKYIKIKRLMAKQYEIGLTTVTSLELPVELDWAKSVYWMYAIRLKGKYGNKRDQFCMLLRTYGIDTRNFFIPLHLQPVLRKRGLFKDEKYPVSASLSNRGFYLPSGLAITRDQIDRVINAIKKANKNI
ncbi:MAG: DegT/DnrJ/EryC1/StrS family aminotransferase [Bacteroidota bacterium]